MGTSRGVLVLGMFLNLSIGSPALAKEGADPSWQLEFQDNPELPKLFRQGGAPRADGSSVTFYLAVGEKTDQQRLPVFIFLDGSGAQSHFTRMGDKIGYSLGGMIARQVVDRYHAVLIEKRGIEFGYINGQPGAGEGGPAEYNRFATLDGRAGDVSAVLNVLLKEPLVDPQRVIVVGHSEGSLVAAAAAARDPRITHVGYLGAGGACQFFDLITLQRKAMAEAGASAEEIEAAVQALEADYRKILADPDSDTKFFQGHAYRRWSTFGFQPAVENLLKTRAKLFLAHGDRDRAVPIEAFDYLVVELMRNGRKDLTVRRIPEGDHGFMTRMETSAAVTFGRIIEEIIAWASAD